jgi:hypothetical protein
MRYFAIALTFVAAAGLASTAFAGNYGIPGPHGKKSFHVPVRHGSPHGVHRPGLGHAPLYKPVPGHPWLTNPYAAQPWLPARSHVRPYPYRHVPRSACGSPPLRYPCGPYGCNRRGCTHCGGGGLRVGGPGWGFSIGW